LNIDSAIPPRSWLGRLAARVFRFETMSGAGRCPVYLERWTLATAFGCGVYLHHFIGDDWALDPHDHPRRFISIGLKGWYFEDVFESHDPGPSNGLPQTRLVKTETYSAPWVRSFPAEHLHRVRAAECGDVWTLVIVLRKSRPWGFVRDGLWVPFRDYVFGGIARHDC
jgi:hypothetical protein